MSSFKDGTGHRKRSTKTCCLSCEKRMIQKIGNKIFKLCSTEVCFRFCSCSTKIEFCCPQRIAHITLYRISATQLLWMNCTTLLKLNKQLDSLNSIYSPALIVTRRRVFFTATKCINLRMRLYYGTMQRAHLLILRGSAEKKAESMQATNTFQGLYNSVSRKGLQFVESRSPSSFCSLLSNICTLEVTPC